MNIAEKIKKLLALAANNANPNEAALAMERAQDLMVKYAIEEDALSSDPLRVKEAINTEAMGMGLQRIPHWEIRLLNAISRAFFCRVWYRPGRDAFICGRETDRMALKATFEYLRAECKRMADHAWNRVEVDAMVHGKRWKNGFYEGCVATVTMRMTDAMKLLVVDNAGTAIVLANRQKDVDQWVNLNITLRANGARSKSMDPSGYHQGKAAGHALNLDKRAGANRQLGA
jgi:hypothetical protein